MNSRLRANLPTQNFYYQQLVYIPVSSSTVSQHYKPLEFEGLKKITTEDEGSPNLLSYEWVK